MNANDANKKIELIIESRSKYLTKTREGEEEQRLVTEIAKEIERVIDGLTTTQISSIILKHALCAFYLEELDKERQKIDELKEHLIQAKLASRARAAAYLRHRSSPKQKAKEKVRGLWLDWQQNAPARYRSASAFARDMLDKFPDELSSQQTIQKWVTAWKKESGLNQE